MRKFLTLVLPVCLLLSACWDYKDLNKLSVVTGMAFDTEADGRLRVTLEIVDRSASPEKEGLRTRSVEASGRDVEEAVGKAERGLEYKLYYGAMAVAVFGQDAPADKLQKWLLDNREARETVYVIHADEAWKKLQTEEDGGIASYKLRDILDASKEEKPLELYRAGGAGR